MTLSDHSVVHRNASTVPIPTSVRFDVSVTILILFVLRYPFHLSPGCHILMSEIVT